MFSNKARLCKKDENDDDIVIELSEMDYRREIRNWATIDLNECYNLNNGIDSLALKPTKFYKKKIGLSP